MFRLRILPVLLAVVAGAACNEDDDRITGPYVLFVSELQDTCDQEENQFNSQLDIALDGDTFIVTFADTAVLDGMIDNQGLIQVDGLVQVPIVVEGQQLLIESFMRMQISVRREQLEATGRIEFDGTHPASLGVACFQEFAATGQRP